MKRMIAMALPVLVLTACGKDSVPQVDDPHNIVVNGERMTQAKFLETYCTGKGDNETCLKVLQAMRADVTRGAVPRF